jgi:plastocyanin
LQKAISFLIIGLVIGAAPTSIYSYYQITGIQNAVNQTPPVFEMGGSVLPSRQNMTELEESKIKLEIEISNLRMEVQNLQNEISELEKRNASASPEVEPLKNQITSLQSRITIVEKDKFELENQLRAALNQLSNLRDSLQAVQNSRCDESNCYVDMLNALSNVSAPYSPQNLTVRPGATVIFVNKGKFPHTASSGLSPFRDRIFDTGQLRPTQQIPIKTGKAQGASIHEWDNNRKW